jgi:hypothetical protein
MPSEFAMSPVILAYWTNVGFLPAESRAYGRGFMSYYATNAEQKVAFSLRFENSVIARTEAVGADSEWWPANRMLFTTAYLGVSGACGHLADGTTNHKAWHQFIVGGWKFFSWGDTGRSSSDSAEQPGCEPPPPPPPQPPPSSGGGNSDEYEGGCELCQQWFYVIDYQIVDEWWECSSTPDYFCEGLMT